MARALTRARRAKRPALKRGAAGYLAVAGPVLTLATWLPLLRVHNRWIRMLDFPRLQLALWALVNLGVIGMGTGGRRGPRQLLALVHAASILRHVWKLVPYTPLMKVQVADAPATASPGDAVGLLVSNVLMTNRRAAGLLEHIRKEDPDLILLVETDAWWMEQLAVLDERYRWHIKIPQANTYGMALYSRLPLRDTRVDRRIQEGVPSIHAVVELPSGRAFLLYGVHPRPPTEEDTDARNAELYLVGKETRDSDLPCLVAGDLNDVAWSRTTALFQEVSGTLDPRVGRGFFNTFHAECPLLRFSLDHVFHTPHFSLIDLRRLAKFGSDHFAIFVRLLLDPERPGGDEPPPPDKDEKKEIADTIAEAKSKSRSSSN